MPASGLMRLASVSFARKTPRVRLKRPHPPKAQLVMTTLPMTLRFIMSASASAPRSSG